MCWSFVSDWVYVLGYESQIGNFFSSSLFVPILVRAQIQLVLRLIRVFG